MWTGSFHNKAGREKWCIRYTQFCVMKAKVGIQKVFRSDSMVCSCIVGESPICFR